MVLPLLYRWRKVLCAGHPAQSSRSDSAAHASLQQGRGQAAARHRDVRRVEHPPNGLEQQNLVVWDNVTPGPNPPDLNPSGSHFALYVIGQGFFGATSSKVGSDTFIKGIQASLDLVLPILIPGASASSCPGSFFGLAGTLASTTARARRSACSSSLAPRAPSLRRLSSVSVAIRRLDALPSPTTRAPGPPRSITSRCGCRAQNLSNVLFRRRPRRLKGDALHRRRAGS